MATNKPRSIYAGMTVNERLFAAGLLDDWDAAKARDDMKEMRRIAAMVDLYLDKSGMPWSDPKMGKRKGRRKRR